MFPVLPKYDAHLEECRKVAHIRGLTGYREFYERSMEDPDGFWSEQAETYLSWERKWHSVVDWDFDEGIVRWFDGGVLNASYNCLDRHLEHFADRVAFFWEPSGPGDPTALTYGELHRQVGALAWFLLSRGIGRGDRVIVYMPWLVQLPAVLLACARIGAVASTVSTEYGAEALSVRMRDFQPKALFTVDESFSNGRSDGVHGRADFALEQNPDVETVVVVKRSGKHADLRNGRDVWYHEALERGMSGAIPPAEPMEAEDPLFVAYTSTTGGNPKGLVHTHGGYLTAAAMTTRLVFDVKGREVLWNTNSPGSIAGLTYGVFGPLLTGLSSVLCEGTGDFPVNDTAWRILKKYGVEILYSSPTWIRSAARSDDKGLQRHDTSRLKILASVGGPLDEPSWKWLYESVGAGRLPVIDTWLQAEGGVHMMAPLPGVAPLKPGSCGFPLFGVDPVILDPNTGDEARFPNQEGILCIRRPWPGMACTIHGDHDRYVESYFSRLPDMFLTGDAAVRDEEGYYKITGRTDDVIIVSDHRVAMAEVESALTGHHAIAEAGVVGYPHPIKGQGVYAFVALAEGVTLSPALQRELAGLVEQRIGAFAALDFVQWSVALPRTRTGKILRRILQKIAAGLFDELGDTSAVAEPTIIQELIKGRQALLADGDDPR
ncbi:MAG: acetate--CoA ligase [Pseudomonadota bacterium]